MGQCVTVTAAGSGRSVNFGARPGQRAHFEALSGQPADCEARGSHEQGVFLASTCLKVHPVARNRLKYQPVGGVSPSPRRIAAWWTRRSARRRRRCSSTARPSPRLVREFGRPPGRRRNVVVPLATTPSSATSMASMGSRARKKINRLAIAQDRARIPGGVLHGAGSCFRVGPTVLSLDTSYAASRHERVSLHGKPGSAADSSGLADPRATLAEWPIDPCGALPVRLRPWTLPLWPTS